ncbi:MAG TPA: TetR family transcriptional regulator [Nakamurella sp.]|jgi:AcrR family transcriptional regulator|nr:TetR family transcriptional regulator [Nakamurella sp.]
MPPDHSAQPDAAHRLPSVPRRTGRRPGNPDTRETILQAARATFAASGFTGATIRGIAARAGVDPALVHHYFGTKENLLLATVQVPVNPREVVDTVTAGPVQTLGTRLAGMVLGVWASPAGTALAAAMRSAIDDPAIARTIREFLLSQVIGRVLRHVGCPPQELDLRAALLASQMLGVIMGRHILKLEPLASQPIEALVPQVGATLQRYLTGPLVTPGAE